MVGSASQAGFYYQNNIAALKIIDCLFFDNDIKYIFLENYDKGNHIDDIIVYRKTKTDYFQVKWTESLEKSYTLFSLLSTSESQKKSLFKQLAEGYVSVKSNPTPFSIVLFSTKKISSTKRPSKNIKIGLTDLVKNVITPLNNSTNNYSDLSLDKKHLDTLKIIQKETDLNDTDFNSFLKTLNFSLDNEPIEQIQNAIKSKFQHLGLEISLFEKLLDNVVKWSISGDKINKELLLKSLGIADRFEDKLSHFFKIVDDRNYVPNQKLIEKLDESLQLLKGGYIFIEGLPGIGKSTALTKYRQSNPSVVFTYYCFIPEGNDFGEPRYKTKYFLKSMCIAIEKAFDSIDFPNKYSEDYDEKLILYLNELSQLDRKIVFIIDGLDHVHRGMEFKSESLLNQITGKLPEGIFFILSSQYKSVLSNNVKAQINADSRRHIIVEKFTQPAIIKFLKSKGVDGEENIDLLEKVSGGIPLYLHYISELLIKSDKYSYSDLLHELPKLSDGQIDEYHEYLYSKIEDDIIVLHILSLLAHRKEFTSVSTISEILKSIDSTLNKFKVENKLKAFSHLLRKHDGITYSIFHNSFREFILFKTQSLHQLLNNALAKFYEKTPYGDESYRNYFKHLFEIGEYQKIIDCVSIEWAKKAWANYRTIEEINHNVHIAWNATAKLGSLKDFIRVGFIKAQILRIYENLSNSDLDFSSLFLDVNLSKHSLRSIWDGDNVLINKPQFAQYLIKYYERNGNLLPQNIINQGLSKYFSGGTPDDMKDILKSKLLSGKRLKNVFSEVEKITWTNNNDHEKSYQRKDFSEKKNTKINEEIIDDIISFLIRFKEIKILKNYLEEGTNSILIPKVKIALVKIIVESEKETAIKILKQISLNKLKKDNQRETIIYLIDFLSDKEIRQIFKSYKFELPEISDSILEKKEFDSVIKESMKSLFSSLKLTWVFKPNQIKRLFLKISTFSNPARSMYSSIFYLLEIWQKKRIENITEEECFDLFKNSLIELNAAWWNSKKWSGIRNHDSTYYAINRDIYYFFLAIFQDAITILPNSYLTQLFDFWRNISEKFNNYKLYLECARFIKKIHFNESDELCYSLIKIAENQIRKEEQTNELAASLMEICSVYGFCGFTKESELIYNQLFEINFGVYYKKDYQASYIMSPLRKLHELDSTNTLSRIHEILIYQNQLKEAGSGKMHHICLSDIIAFTAEEYLELSFELIRYEEESINRYETIDIVLTPLIRKANKDEIILLYSIAKSLPRFEHSNYYFGLTLQIIRRVIEINLRDFIEQILKDVKHHIYVEMNELDKLQEISKIFIAAGKDLDNFDLPPLSKEIDNITPHQSIPNRRRKFLIKPLQYKIENLISVLETDYRSFEEILNNLLITAFKNRRNQNIRREYHTLKRVFEGIVKKTRKLLLRTLKKSSFGIIRNLIILKNELVEFKSGEILKYEELEILVDSFIDRISIYFLPANLEEVLKVEFDKKKWIDDLLKEINERRDLVIRNLLTDSEIATIVKKTSILSYENILKFINSWLFYKVKAESILTISKRLSAIDIEKSKELLLEVSTFDRDLLFHIPGYSKPDITPKFFESFAKSDPNFVKRVLLQSYISETGKYSDSIVSTFNSLLDFESYFNDSNIHQTHYESNLYYNTELAKGLPEKERNYSFVKNHVPKFNQEEIIIKYLVSLFDYPVVKVRELTIQSLLDLIVKLPKLLPTLNEFGIVQGNANQIEHTLTVFHLLSYHHSKILIPLKKQLWELIKKKHFNIIEEVKSLLFRINKTHNGFLLSSELATLNRLNKASKILTTESFLQPHKAKRFLYYSKFQNQLLQKLTEYENDITDFSDEVYTDLITKKGYRDYSFEMESEVHKEYNLNTNFDTIEINSSYFDATNESINQVLFKKIKKGCFEEEFISQIKSVLRLYNPIDFLVKKKIKPDYISWVTKGLSEVKFLEFQDWDNQLTNFANREKEFITIYEEGGQRPLDKYADQHFTTYFQVRAFLVDEQLTESEILVIKNRYDLVANLGNCYLDEIPSSFSNSDTFPTKEIIPILGISNTNFRGQEGLGLACLLPDILEKMKMEKLTFLDIMVNEDKENPLQYLVWQNSYSKGTGRRRYKPTSEGVQLKIKKENLRTLLKKTGYSLGLHFFTSRSTDKYKTESEMEWIQKEKIIVLKDI